ncbi:Adenylylsulfatase HINT1 [Zea mays]|uniref:Adenylylsulfatase HINT1 n=1 Tax=Zea mays TaxID=4577 RepID=A0A1D6N929_MAIZE|nr:Adenylylsulfatase HINT1 [Zea mays]
MRRNSPPTASGNRLAVIASHLSLPPLGSPAAISGEKEAALATDLNSTPTMSASISSLQILHRRFDSF